MCNKHGFMNCGSSRQRIGFFANSREHIITTKYLSRKIYYFVRYNRDDIGSD